MGFMLVSYKNGLFCGINMSWSVVSVCFLRISKGYLLQKAFTCFHLLSLTVANLLYCHYCHCHCPYISSGQTIIILAPKSAKKCTIWENIFAWVRTIIWRLVEFGRHRIHPASLGLTEKSARKTTAAAEFDVQFFRHRYMDPTTSFRDCVTIGALNIHEMIRVMWIWYSQP